MIVKWDRMLEIDGSQILTRAVFEASGHLFSFSDPIVRCSKCRSVYRPDKLLEEKTRKQVPEKLQDHEYDSLMAEAGVKCLKCGSALSGTGRFNMMFKVGIGPTQDEAYLRPETCQSIFVDFPLLFKTQRVKLPVGVAQVGRSFRNEIAPRQGLLRLRELNQAEVEIFFNPKRTNEERNRGAQNDELTFLSPDGLTRTVSVAKAIEEGTLPSMLVGYYLAAILRFYEAAGLPRERIRFRVLSEEDRAFYSKAAYDLEVKLSVGWLELVACNYRSDYDLQRHSSVSGTDFTVEDEGEKVLPHVFELSMGIDRTVYAILESAWKVESERRYLALKPYLAPLKAGIFPLVKKDGLPEVASRVFIELSETYDVFYDESGSIGRRYARADEVGVPCCLTVDYDTLKDRTVTLRNRNDRVQERIPIPSIMEKLAVVTRIPRMRELKPEA